MPVAAEEDNDYRSKEIPMIGIFTSLSSMRGTLAADVTWLRRELGFERHLLGSGVILVECGVNRLLPQ